MRPRGCPSIQFRRAAPSRSPASSRAAVSGVTPRSRGDREDPRDGLSDPERQLDGAFLGVALELHEHMDQAAGVGDEVRRVEDPALGEDPGERIVGELVVGRPADDLAAQLTRRWSASIAPPSAHGASTSHSARVASPGSTPGRAEHARRARACPDRCRSPAARSRRRRGAARAAAPTWPSPTTQTRAPGEIGRCRSARRRRPGSPPRPRSP